MLEKRAFVFNTRTSNLKPASCFFLNPCWTPQGYFIHLHCVTLCGAVKCVYFFNKVYKILIYFDLVFKKGKVTHNKCTFGATAVVGSTSNFI